MDLKTDIWRPIHFSSWGLKILTSIKDACQTRDYWVCPDQTILLLTCMGLEKKKKLGRSNVPVDQNTHTLTHTLTHTHTHTRLYKWDQATLYNCCVIFPCWCRQEPCVSLQLLHRIKRNMLSYRNLLSLGPPSSFFLSFTFFLFCSPSLFSSCLPLPQSSLSLPVSLPPLSLSFSAERPQGGLVSSNMWFLFTECKQ